MANQDGESGLELVLDNKKLILAFAVVIAICGCFFVVGFMEGKRQGLQEVSQTAAEFQPKSDLDATQGQTGKPAGGDTAAKQPDVADQYLNWYKNVNRRESEPEPISEPPKTPVILPETKPEPETKAEPVTYTVQVGAFRQEQELEARARLLREKGFGCRTEPPQAPGDFYLLKVGKFRTRAEAAAMQLRLKKGGFSSFIKTEKPAASEPNRPAGG